jgi:RNA polymerase sigma-70 factor (ECF subfamily)
MIVLVLPDVGVDEALLSQARANDQDALRVIYQRYFSSVYQFIRLRINDAEQARDLTADVFLDFFVALRGRNAPRTSLRAWLFRVARNKIYDQYGKNKQFPTVTLDEWVPASPDLNPEMAVVRTLEAQHTRRALRMLAAEQQEVLILRFGQGLSLQETADLMDKSVSAVKSLQFRAVDTLRQILDAGDRE